MFGLVIIAVIFAMVVGVVVLNVMGDLDDL